MSDPTDPTPITAAESAAIADARAELARLYVARSLARLLGAVS